MKTVYFAPLRSEKRLLELTERIRSARPGEILLVSADDWNAVRDLVSIQVPDEQPNGSE